MGCGTGAMLVPFSKAVGKHGTVVGMDISAAMIAAAQQLVARASLANVKLVMGDIQTHEFDPASFDLLVSRFGVMFFDEPVAAFHNLRQSTRPGGRLCFVCWRPLQENPHWSLALAAVTRRLGPPDTKSPRAPGPFAFGDVAYVEEVLRSAGFIDIRISRQSPSLVGTSPEEEAEFLCTMGPAAALIAEREPAVEVIEQIKGELTAALRPFARDDQLLIPLSISLVHARRS
jgi:SAM-dependent methyltransferase